MRYSRTESIFSSTSADCWSIFETSDCTSPSMYAKMSAPKSSVKAVKRRSRSHCGQMSP